MPRSIAAFVLTASFGAFLVGCSAPEPQRSFEEFSFTEEDLERVHRLASEELPQTGTGEEVVSLDVFTGSTLPTTSVVLDPEAQRRYDAIRTNTSLDGRSMYRVSNAFLNVREGMSVSSRQIARLEQGDAVEVVDIPNASWAKIKMQDGREGFVSFRYISKLTTEERLAEEKKRYEGQYYVDFSFLNVRRDASPQADKIGELGSNAIVTPLSMGGEWARIPFGEGEGYVSSRYLRPFSPSFLVRQDRYTLPILRYKADETGSLDALRRHIVALKAANKRIVTLQSFFDLVLQQEVRDARVLPGTVVLTVTGLNGQNATEVSQILSSNGVSATLFIASGQIGINGITERMILTLLANGNDLQPAGHTGDDLRSLTDSQVELELGQSKKILEEFTKRTAYAVAYPKGGVNDRVAQKAAQVGYLFGLGEVPEKQFSRSQFLRLPSILIGSSLSDDDVVRLTE